VFFVEPRYALVAMELDSIRERARQRRGLVLFVTGAGVSAESGIPTFRGPEGYWTEGSEVYHPQSLATHAAFERSPDTVWRWYLHRRRICREAAPNAAHRALARLEAELGDDFLLITQNVDGLHLRAGNTMEHCYQVHGNIDYMRCSRGCTTTLFEIPEEDGDDEPVERLSCERCGERARPHVLWFDECYDEELYRFESSLRAASQAEILVTVGSTASTNLPVHVARLAAAAGAMVVDLNIDDNPFASMAELALRGPASELVPAVVDAIAPA
jgi:NAD-dependent deacetylase